MIASWVRWTFLTAAAISVALLGYTGWSIWTAYHTVSKISQLEFDPVQTRADLQQQDSAPPTTAPLGAEQSESEPVDELQTFLIVGSDNRPAFPGNRADVILMVILPAGDARPILFSLPRDLWVRSPCHGTSLRINTLLSGCGDTASGPELLAVAVEDFTGVGVDHFALIDFAGFEEVVDAFGGVEVCLDHAIRDDKVDYPGVILPAGCSMADGAQALAWVRSRKTLEYIDGVGWRTQPGVNDLVRNERQQELLFGLLARVGRFRDITRLVTLAESVADALVVDDQLSVSRSVSLVWEMRNLRQEDVIQLKVPVEYYTTEAGASVLRPVGDFAQLLSDALAGIMVDTAA